MKDLLIIAMAFTLTLNSFGQSAELGVGAIGLVVSDIEVSEQFYTDILGFIPSGGFELTSEWSDEAGMAGGNPFAVKLFRLQEKESATVLKLAYFENTAKGKQTTGIDKESGVNYITFYYDTLTDVKDRIMQADIPLVGEVERPAYKILIIRDPDGVFVELIELKEQK